MFDSCWLGWACSHSNSISAISSESHFWYWFNVDVSFPPVVCEGNVQIWYHEITLKVTLRGTVFKNQCCLWVIYKKCSKFVFSIQSPILNPHSNWYKRVLLNLNSMHSLCLCVRYCHWMYNQKIVRRSTFLWELILLKARVVNFWMYCQISETV